MTNTLAYLSEEKNNFISQSRDEFLTAAIMGKELHFKCAKHLKTQNQ